MTQKSLLKIFFILNISIHIKAFDTTIEPKDSIADISGLIEKTILLNRSDTAFLFQEPSDLYDTNIKFCEYCNSSELFQPFLNPDNTTQILQKQNILRWLPTRKRKPELSEQERQQIYTDEVNKVKAIQKNEKMRSHVLQTMKTNFWTSLYLYGEVDRIRRSRVVLDDMRLMIKTLELRDYAHIKKAVLDCYRQEKHKRERHSSFWKGKNPNKMVINIVKDNPNDGVV